jgi:hypothetical protein
MAVPHPEQELARVQQLLRKELPPLLVLAGPGAYFRETALAKVLAAVPADAELATVDGQEVEVRGLPGEEAGAGAETGDDDDLTDSAPPAACRDLELLRGGGLFSKRAFVVVRRADRWVRRYAPALAQALPKFQSGSGLVLEAQKVDRRTRAFKDAAERGVLFEFRDLYDQPWDRSRGPLESELVKWVQAQGRLLSVPLQPEAALLLCEHIGKAPGELRAELERLHQLQGKAPRTQPLQPADLRGKLLVGFESTPFELADAVLQRDRPAAFRSLRAMFDRAVKARDGRPMEQGGKFPFATSWLFQCLGQLHEGRVLMETGVRAEDVPARVGVRGFVDRYAAQLQKNGREQLERGMAWLLHVQRDRRLTGEEDDALLERFLVAWFDGAPPPERELEW